MECGDINSLKKINLRMLSFYLKRLLENCGICVHYTNKNSTEEIKSTLLHGSPTLGHTLVEEIYKLQHANIFISALDYDDKTINSYQLFYTTW